MAQNAGRLGTVCGDEPARAVHRERQNLDWADHIFVMEQKHKDRIKAAFPRPCRFAKIHVLDIPDEYQYADPELMEIIKLSTEGIVTAR